MRRLAQITDQHLLKTTGNLPPAELRNDDSKRSFLLSVAVIKYFLGEEWIEEYLSPQGAADSLLRVVPGEDADTQISAFKIVDSAQLLYNLQDIPRCYVRIDRIRRGILEPTTPSWISAACSTAAVSNFALSSRNNTRDSTTTST